MATNNTLPKEEYTNQYLTESFIEGEALEHVIGRLQLFETFNVTSHLHIGPSNGGRLIAARQRAIHIDVNGSPSNLVNVRYIQTLKLKFLSWKRLDKRVSPQIFMNRYFS